MAQEKSRYFTFLLYPESIPSDWELKLDIFVSDREMTKKKLVTPNFCKNRFCPLCAWRKACQDGLLLATMIKALCLVLFLFLFSGDMNHLFFLGFFNWCDEHQCSEPK